MLVKLIFFLIEKYVKEPMFVFLKCTNPLPDYLVNFTGKLFAEKIIQ